MTKRYESEVLASVHETALGMTEAGVMSKRTMKAFDELCLTPAEDMSPERIREIRLREATSLIKAADNLAIAARHLRTCRLHNVPAGELGTIEDGMDRSRYGMGMGRLVLFAVIVELCIKGLRLLEEPARQIVRRHVVVELYRDLAPDTQAAIEAIYERCREQHAHVVQAGSDKTDGVALASIQEALAWNDEAMVSLKYDLKPKGVTIPANAMWDGDTVWFMVGGVQAENFAEALANYALGRLRGT